jgi:RNA polymerase subunit RPABC4/transcription elongation factor Spt4
MKLEGDTTCPNCKKDHSVSFDVDKFDLAKSSSATLYNVSVTPTSNNATVQVQAMEPKQTHSHAEPQEDPHEELSKLLPKGINFGKCANGNCGTKFKNAKGLTKKYKACPGCKTNTVPKSSDFCPTCGKEDEDWDESDVELEDEEDE